MTKYDSRGAFEKLHEDPFLPPVPPAPKKKMSGWAITGLIIAGLLVFGMISNAIEGNTAASSPVTYDDPTDLVSYNGTTVGEMVSMTEGLPEMTAICDIIPTVGYDEARQSYLDAEPQLGSDAYEGAVFDSLFAGC